ncbi:MAG: PTS transporter subunit EIIC [Mollicutes bacterium PWAP]|nr:PTS transporter subunit EIIC [Mollicutes bacterium PWAP]
MLPAILTLLSATVLKLYSWYDFFFANEGVTITNDGTIQSLSYVIDIVVTKPFISFAQSGADIGILLVYVFMVSFLFFFGIHGPNTLNGIFRPIALILLIGNINGGHNVFFEGVYNGFGYIGGAGGTLPLVILTLWILKGGSEYEAAKFALPTGIFEINEPVIFGFPILFNFKYFIPYVFGPMLAVLWPIAAIKIEWMNLPLTKKISSLNNSSSSSIPSNCIAIRLKSRNSCDSINFYIIWCLFPICSFNKKSTKKAKKWKIKKKK